MDDTFGREYCGDVPASSVVPEAVGLLGAEPSLTRLGSSSSTANLGEFGVLELLCRRNIFPDSVDDGSDFFVNVCLRGIDGSRGGSLDLAYVAGGFTTAGCGGLGGLAGERSRFMDAEVGRKRS